MSIAKDKPSPQDRRFTAPEWQEWPFQQYYQSFLFWQEWLNSVTTGVRGMSRHDQQIVNFAARQLLDSFAPTNFPWTNPEVLKASWEQGGGNFFRGMMNFLDDSARAMLGSKPAGTESFQVGKNVAVTPGKVIFRNRLTTADGVIAPAREPMPPAGRCRLRTCKGKQARQQTDSYKTTHHRILQGVRVKKGKQQRNSGAEKPTRFRRSLAPLRLISSGAFTNFNARRHLRRRLVRRRRGSPIRRKTAEIP